MRAAPKKTWMNALESLLEPISFGIVVFLICLMQTPQGTFLATFLSPSSGLLFTLLCGVFLFLLVTELQYHFFEKHKFWPQVLIIISLWAFAYKPPLLAYPWVVFICKALFTLSLFALPFTAQAAAKSSIKKLPIPIIRNIGLIFLSSIIIFSPIALPFTSLCQGFLQWASLFAHGFFGRQTLSSLFKKNHQPSPFSPSLNAVQVIISIPILLVLVNSSIPAFTANIIFLVCQWIPIESLLNLARKPLLFKTIKNTHKNPSFFAKYLTRTYSKNDLEIIAIQLPTTANHIKSSGKHDKIITQESFRAFCEKIYPKGGIGS